MKNRVACATPLQEMAPAVPKSVALGASPGPEFAPQGAFIHWVIGSLGIVRLKEYLFCGTTKQPLLVFRG